MKISSLTILNLLCASSMASSVVDSFAGGMLDQLTPLSILGASGPASMGNGTEQGKILSKKPHGKLKHKKTISPKGDSQQPSDPTTTLPRKVRKIRKPIMKSSKTLDTSNSTGSSSGNKVEFSPIMAQLFDNIEKYIAEHPESDPLASLDPIIASFYDYYHAVKHSADGGKVELPSLIRGYFDLVREIKELFPDDDYIGTAQPMKGMYEHYLQVVREAESSHAKIMPHETLAQETKGPQVGTVSLPDGIGYKQVNDSFEGSTSFGISNGSALLPSQPTAIPTAPAISMEKTTTSSDNPISPTDLKSISVTAETLPSSSQSTGSNVEFPSDIVQYFEYVDGYRWEKDPFEKFNMVERQFYYYYHGVKSGDKDVEFPPLVREYHEMRRLFNEVFPDSEYDVVGSDRLSRGMYEYYLRLHAAEKSSQAKAIIDSQLPIPKETGDLHPEKMVVGSGNLLSHNVSTTFDSTSQQCSHSIPMLVGSVNELSIPSSLSLPENGNVGIQGLNIHPTVHSPLTADAQLAFMLAGCYVMNHFLKLLR